MFKIYTLAQLIVELDKYKHAELHVHHTWKPTHKSFNGSNHIALQQGMKDNHMNVKNWSDIGQHVTLMPDGKFVTGRDFGKIPASIEGENSQYGIPAFACEMLGNFDVEGKAGTVENTLGYDKLEGAQLEAILGLAKYFNDKGRYIRFHRENASKTCPGNGIDKAEFMKLVKTKPVAVSNPVITKLTPYEQEILDAIKFVQESGISDGLNIKDVATREQMFVMLHRFKKKMINE